MAGNIELLPEVYSWARVYTAEEFTSMSDAQRKWVFMGGSMSQSRFGRWSPDVRDREEWPNWKERNSDGAKHDGYVTGGVTGGQLYEIFRSVMICPGVYLIFVPADGSCLIYVQELRHYLLTGRRYFKGLAGTGDPRDAANAVRTAVLKSGSRSSPNEFLHLDTAKHLSDLQEGFGALMVFPPARSASTSRRSSSCAQAGYPISTCTYCSSSHTITMG